MRSATLSLSAKTWRVPYPLGMHFSQTVNLFDAHSIISTLGLIGILAIIFMETGLLIGLFFPGDSLLFLAGVGASGAAAKVFDGVQIEIISLLIAAPLVAIIGSQTGYWIGAKYGVKLFDRPDGRIFNQKKVQATQKWLNKYGTGKALVLDAKNPGLRYVWSTDETTQKIKVENSGRYWVKVINLGEMHNLKVDDVNNAVAIIGGFILHFKPTMFQFVILVMALRGKGLCMRPLILP